ncbi:ABC transporter permease/M1 family aminopeptidase [Flavobacterium branchiicola]|uniref:ABC transporter permease/M1 family aminopeptidase n=1 Tax=Flavobacterium branchiicola TaxID=1114875 RepID=A0ABV9PAI9_9FLAO|nr:M1 family aminopeptidase [Flavobacterium branchiicola]MBS7252340.1 aminopeptidase [Flavobacterium branchiicola]
MLSKFIQFEWHNNTRNWTFYASYIIYLILGFFVSAFANFSFSGAYKNSPFVLTYAIGLLSLMTIFSATLQAAQSFLKEYETKFDAIIFSTPISKFHFLGSKFITAFVIAVSSFGMFIIGMILGHQLSSFPKGEIGPFEILNYIWPYLVIVIPNILLCLSILATLAWLTRSKLFIYVGGLFIYILYIAGSIFSNSPLFANASPSSAKAMSLAAKIDPFGLAAFLEQTRYWTSIQKNTQLISLSGNFLFNRILWIFISFLLLFVSYKLFSFRKTKTKKVKTIKTDTKEIKVFSVSIPKQEFKTSKHNWAVFKSNLKMDIYLVLKGIPFLLIALLFSGLLMIEISDEIDGGIRLAENITNTALMISTIMDRIPFILILILLFYSSELLNRSENSKFEMLENTAPYSPFIVLLSKLTALYVIPLILIGISILIGIGFQIINAKAPIETGLYLSMFYYIGFPLFLISILVISIQTFIKNRYLGLAISAFIVLLFCTGIGEQLGISHPLFRFGDSFKREYFDLNGFGSYTFPFHISMLYNFGLALILLTLTGILWKRNVTILKTIRRNSFNAFQKTTFAFGSILFIGFGSYLFYKTNIEYPYLTKDDQNNWSEQYEKQFKKYTNLAQPTIFAVKSKVDLFPEENRYEVKGTYELVNNSEKAIDSLLLYIDRNSKLTSVEIENAKNLDNVAKFQHYWYRFKKPLRPQQKIKMSFAFTSTWSPFKGHTAFNSIIENGSFMRISRYFPTFGYQDSNEISSEKERTKRHLKPQTPLKKLEDKSEFQNDFIDYDVVVSTSKNQTAIGVGDLIQSWKKDNRNYFHYKSNGKIPFRFAFSSAEYQIQKTNYKGISIEVYYDKRHSRNVFKLIKDLKNTLDYCQNNFGKYPYKTIRYAEVSAFADGFAATSYPSTVFMKENFGFYSTLSKDKEDVINQLTAHELSHEWWGNAQISPEQKEGSWILTETLAQYTELMLYEKEHGLEKALETLKIHLDLYLSSRSYDPETPLHKTNYETPCLPYDKGMLVMHQLRILIGEEKVNLALQNFLSHYKYPNAIPDSEDLLKEIYLVTDSKLYPKLDEMFKKIITYSSKISEVESLKKNGFYEISFKAESKKYLENATGVRKQIANDVTIDIGIYDENGKLFRYTFPVKDNKIEGKIKIKNKPQRIVIDPYLMNIDTFIKDNEKEID